MKAIEKVTRASHLIDMDDIIREGKSNTSSCCRRCDLPLSDQEIILGEKWCNSCTILKILLWLKTWPPWREWTPLPQLDISKRIIAVLVPQSRRCRWQPPKEAYSLQSHVQSKGCRPFCSRCGSWRRGRLSLCRPATSQAMWFAMPVWLLSISQKMGKKRIKLKGYNSIVVQHEIDHTNGIMFYDRINPNNPFEIKEGLLILE